MFWFSLRLLSETFLILRGTEWDMIIIVRRFSCQVPAVRFRFHWNLNFFNRFSKNTKTWNFMKIRPVGAELLQADRQTDGRTDMTKLLVAFRNFANAPKNESNTGLFKMIVGVLTTFHTQYTWDRGGTSIFFLFNKTKLQVFVTYLTGALYVHTLWFYKYQHDNQVRSKLFVACQRWWFQWRFWFLPSVPRYTRTLSLETVHTNFEWNCQMVVVSRIWWGIAAGQLYPDNHF